MSSITIKHQSESINIIYNYRARSSITHLDSVYLRTTQCTIPRYAKLSCTNKHIPYHSPPLGIIHHSAEEIKSQIMREILLILVVQKLRLRKLMVLKLCILVYPKTTHPSGRAFVDKQPINQASYIRLPN